MNDIARDAGLGGGLVAASVTASLLTVWATGPPGGDHGGRAAPARPVPTVSAHPVPRTSGPRSPARATPDRSSTPDRSVVPPAGGVVIASGPRPAEREAARPAPAAPSGPSPRPTATSSPPAAVAPAPAPCGGDLLAVPLLRVAGCVSIGGQR